MTDLLVALAAGAAVIVCSRALSVARGRNDASRALSRLGRGTDARIAGSTTAGPRPRERRALLTGFAERVRATPKGARFAQYVSRTHPHIEFSDALAMTGAAMIGGFLAGSIVFGRSILSFLAAGAAPLVLDRVLVRAGGRRASRIEQQLPDGLALQSSALRAGNSTTRSLRLLAAEAPSPLGEEVRGAVEEIDLGGSLDQALGRLASRVASKDVELWVTAMLVHRVTGGNLSTIVDSLAERVRERAHIRAEIRALTAQGRMSGLVVAATPVAFFLLLSVTSREQMQVLYTTPTGILVLLAGLALMGAGFTWIRWILRIKP